MARSVSARALGPPGQLKFGIWSPSRMHPPRRSPYSAPMADAGRQGLRYAWYLASAAAWFSSVGLQQVMTPWLVVGELRASAQWTGMVQMASQLPSLLLLL